MKNRKTGFHIYYIAILIIIVLLLTAVYFSLKFADEKNVNSNAVTMVSGWISAVATVILGCISLWQNFRYKAMADKFDEKIEDLSLKPEIVLCDISFYDNSSPEMTSLYQSYYPDCNDGYLYYISSIFTVVNIPVLDLKLHNVSFEYYDNEENMFLSQNREVDSFQQGSAFKLLHEKDAFHLNFSLPERASATEFYRFNIAKVKFNIMYRNIYDMIYEKTIEFEIRNSVCHVLKQGKSHKVTQTD